VIFGLPGNDGKPLLGNFTAASLLFCLAGATDLADGWIARNFKVGNIFVGFGGSGSRWISFV
jgi:phosphatidylglycerophosphate synthase